VQAYSKEIFPEDFPAFPLPIFLSVSRDGVFEEGGGGGRRTPGEGRLEEWRT